MKRPWLAWTVFGAAFLLVLGAMGWASGALMSMEANRAADAARREHEDTIRRALWRMDAAVAPLVAAETARPPFMYKPFYSVREAYGGLLKTDTPFDAQLPSPLLLETPEFVLLHVEVGPEGLASPQIPAEAERQLAVEACSTPQQIQAADNRLTAFLDCVDSAALGRAAPEPASRLGSRADAGSNLGLPQRESAPVQVADAAPYGAYEKSARAEFLQKQIRGNEANVLNTPQVQTMSMDETAGLEAPAGSPMPNVPGAVSPMRAVWIDNELLLVRRIAEWKSERVQAVWLDRGALHARLLAEARPLLSAAAVVPAAPEQTEFDATTLVSLPFRLDPGPPPPATLNPSPLRGSLIVAWACVLLAGAAAASLLAGALRLSERRARFVSTVSHELRTPLTTFRIYTDLLADKPDIPEAKRAEYTDTMRSEASRLSQIVENVLAFSRLERGRRALAVGGVALGSILDRALPALRERARRAGMEIQAQAPPEARDTIVRADPSAVEQILLNLVDNSCKYARRADDPRIEIEADIRGASASITVRDHGPGIDPRHAASLFRPFRQLRRDGETPSAGVGLGLSLSRRLAREMGGDLTIEAPAPAGPPIQGARFLLTLRRA